MKAVDHNPVILAWEDIDIAIFLSTWDEKNQSFGDITVFQSIMIISQIKL